MADDEYSYFNDITDPRYPYRIEVDGTNPRQPSLAGLDDHGYGCIIDVLGRTHPTFIFCKVYRDPTNGKQYAQGVWVSATVYIRNDDGEEEEADASDWQQVADELWMTLPPLDLSTLGVGYMFQSITNDELLYYYEQASCPHQQTLGPDPLYVEKRHEQCFVTRSYLGWDSQCDDNEVDEPTFVFVLPEVFPTMVSIPMRRGEGVRRHYDDDDDDEEDGSRWNADEDAEGGDEEMEDVGESSSRPTKRSRIQY